AVVFPSPTSTPRGCARRATCCGGECTWCIRSRFLPPAGESFRHFLSHLAILREVAVRETVTFAGDSHETAEEILCFSSCASKQDLRRFGQTTPSQRWRSWRGAMCLRCTPPRRAWLSA